MSSLGVNGRNTSWEVHECDQQFGEIESMDMGKRQRLRKEGNARMIIVSAMEAVVGKTIEKARIS